MKKPVALLYVVLALALVADARAQKDSDEEDTKDPSFKMVINAANPTTEMKSKDISKIFRKTLVRWDLWLDGDERMRVVPVDQVKESEVRKVFSRRIHNKSATALEIYWQRQIFSGNDVNPEKLLSDERVLEFVRNNAGAIGYVSADAELGQGVKELKISD